MQFGVEKKILLPALLGVVVLVLILLSVYYLYLASFEKNSKTANLVTSAPLTLESSTVITQSITLALEEVEYKAGEVSLTLSILEDGDTSGAWDEELERNNAEIAIADPNTVAYIGPINSGAAKISMPLLNEAGILQISSSNTWPGLTKIGFTPGEPGIFYPTGVRHYVRVCTTDDLQGPAGARWAEDLGFRKMYIVDDGEAYGVGIARLFEREAEKLGLEIVGSHTSDTSEESAREYAELIDELGADLVYYGGITPNGGPELLKALRARGSTAAFMGPDGIYEDDFLNAAGSAAEGVYVTSVGIPPTEVDTSAAGEFVRAYRARFNSEPDVFGALAYEATKVVIDAIRKVGSADRAAVMREVRSTKNYNGVFGTWSFDQNGDTSLLLMSGVEVRGGQFEFVKVLSNE